MAKEGFFFYIPFLIITAIFFYLFDRSTSMIFIYLGVVSFIFGNLVLLFFRDPERKIPQEEGIIISPADGKIMLIEEVAGHRLVSIFMSVLNVHINRVPVSGTVVRLDYKPGKFKAAFNREAIDINERFEIEIKSDNGNVVMHQVAGVLARRIVCRLKVGQDVKIGERFGLIRFGSRVDLFLPSSVKVEVTKGQKVEGGKTIIGRFA